MSELSTAPARRPWQEAVKTFFTYLLVGPPIGGFLYTAFVMIEPLAYGYREHILPYAVAYFSLVVMAGMTLSYIFGGVQALMIGIMVATYGLMLGRPPFWVALLSALCVFVALGSLENVSIPYFVAWIASLDYLPRAEWNLEFPLNWMTAARLSAYLVPALVCWYISKRFWSAR